VPAIGVRPAATRANTRRPQALTAASAPRRRIVYLVVPTGLALISIVPFLPALEAGFVNWDDDTNFLNNPDYRGVGAAQLQWMFTTFLMGHYIPLTWMTLGLDYVVWGMNPFGYHLTNILLHAANAALFYFVALRLLLAGGPGRSADATFAPIVGAGFATLLFAIHPLRAESVAWVTERRDVLSGLFYLAVVGAYVRYCDLSVRELGRAHGAREWYWASVGLFALALLSKAMAMTLPAILFVLDAYPLRRLSSIGGHRRWLPSRSLVLEKLPFFLLSLAAAITALVALTHATHVASGSDQISVGADATAGVSLVDRVAISAYALSFYVSKIAVPLGLSAAYELPPPSGFEAWPSYLSGAAILLVTAAVVIGRRRWPALAAIWVAYIVMLSPVIWVPQIAADRYTYLACAGWALLGGVGLAFVWRSWQQRNIDRRITVLLAGLAVAVVVALSILTWNQVNTWRDSETLWTHAVAGRPSSLGHFKLGVTLEHRGNFTKAIENFEAALRINPDYADAHSALGFAFAIQGRLREAFEQFNYALRLRPRLATAHTGLGLLLARQDNLSEAADHFHRALDSDPRDAQAHTNLGLILKKWGQWGEAATHFRQAAQIDPDSEQAQRAQREWGLALAEQGELSEATIHLRAAVRIDPRDARAHQSLGEVLLRQGRADEAEEHFREARLRP
jgi:protein O-mannosyl-transferase